MSKEPDIQMLFTVCLNVSPLKALYRIRNYREEPTNPFLGITRRQQRGKTAFIGRNQDLKPSASTSWGQWREEGENNNKKQ